MMDTTLFFGNIELKDIELHKWVMHLGFRDCDENGPLVLRNLKLSWREDDDRIYVWIDKPIVRAYVLYLDSLKRLSEHIVSLFVRGAKRNS